MPGETPEVLRRRYTRSAHGTAVKGTPYNPGVAATSEPGVGVAACTATAAYLEIWTVLPGDLTE